jgi:hypothetical protein
MPQSSADLDVPQNAPKELSAAPHLSLLQQLEISATAIVERSLRRYCQEHPEEKLPLEKMLEKVREPSEPFAWKRCPD